MNVQPEDQLQLAQNRARKGEVPRRRSHSESGRVGSASHLFSTLPPGTRPTRCLSLSFGCLTRGSAQEYQGDKRHKFREPFPTCSQALQLVAESLARDLSSCRQKQSSSHISKLEKALGNTLRWQSMARFSLKCYFPYLVGNPALPQALSPLCHYQPSTHNPLLPPNLLSISIGACSLPTVS